MSFKEPNNTQNLKYYQFRQNNSGGSFYGPIVVWIQARSAEEANRRAESCGLYFNGANDDGPDCPCCGDRWSRVYEGDGYEDVRYYDRPLKELQDNPPKIRWQRAPENYIIYNFDGTLIKGPKYNENERS